ncbi:protocadherin-12 [Anguilla rostrata]|uniref:protocadherin-12 n=1 Tax=Anguilla rostrata TaxID=7938 RepID=UPI0030D33B79
MQLVLILALWLVPLAQPLDPPPLTIQYQVWEEQPSGSTVGRLSDDLRQRGEAGALDDFRTVEQGQSLPFEVGVQDGAVLTVGQLDREELCRNSNLCEILFSVLYRKDGVVHFLRVRVEVLDLNDHSPVFPNEEQEVEISEMATLRMRIPLDRAVDPDAGPNGLQTYSLSSNQHFALDVKNPSAGPKQAELVVIKELDREVQSSYELTLVAWDKGNPPRSGSTLVKINVLDSNDNSPVFEESTPTIELSEDTARGTTVINLKATDPDQGANGEIEYSFSKHAPLDVQRLFNIDPKTGEVTLIGALDFEAKPSYEIDIQARDLGPNAIPSHCKLHVKVKDINDNAPRIHITWTPPDSPVATVSEDAAEETFLALVMVSDADSGENGEVHIHIRHGTRNFRLKRIHGDNYMIVTNGTLDREKKMEYNLTLVARDHGKPPLSSIRHLPVHVLDENDNAPVFSQTHYEAYVLENNPPGLSVLEVQAQDIDLELGGEVSYSIRESNDLRTPTASFSVDPSSGAVFIEQALDYEVSHTFSFIVEATDQGQPPLTSSATVIINVEDVNDNYPVIEDPLPKKGKASLSVPVNAEKGEIVAELGDKPKDTSNSLFELSSEMSNHSVHIRPEGYLAGTIKASDADSGLNGRLRFQIVNGNSAGLFWMDDTTGQLYVNTSNATELIDKKFEFDVSVSDMGTPTLVTTVTLEVAFINLLDHLKNSSPGQRGQLSFTMMLAICLGATCVLLLLAVALVTTFCRPEKRDNHAYNCRQAESTYTRHPRRPQKQIQKADIQLVPVLRGRREGPLEAEAQPLTCATPELQEPFPPGPFHLSPSLSRTIRNQNFPEENSTLPLSQGRTLRKPGSVELSGTLPRTPATPFRTLRRAKDSESSSSLSQTGTLRRHGGSEAQLQPEDHAAHAAPGSPQSCTLRRQRNAGGQGGEDHRQILRNLVRLSMAAFGENNSIQLSAASPEVQQVSQLLSLLHQGQLQPRPNFRGNKYSHRGGRSGTQDADWLSTKDSGHGESEAGDADWDVGRESPVDPMLEDGLHGQITDDVFSDFPDPEWMARLSLPLAADYHENVFVPEGPASPDSRGPPAEGPGDSASFSTFGKAPEKGGPLPGSLLSEVSTLFEMLLTQKADAQPRTSAEVLYRLSAAYRRSMGLDGPSGGGEKRSPTMHCSGPDSQNQHLN